MKNNMLGYLFAGLCLFCASARAQQGKDGAFTTATTTVVNVYTSLTANAAAGATSISVASATGISTGDLVYIIQMQGADINAMRQPITGDTTSSQVVNGALLYGTVTNYNNCGNNEFAEVNAVSGTTITLDCGLKYSYTSSWRVQVIRVPRYTSLTINSGGNITCPQWNGTTGGIVALEVQNNTTINSGGKIDVSALGFRGGTTHLDTTYGGDKLGCDRYTEGAMKGEGIAGDASFYALLYAGKYGWGAMANGGGGGAPMNGGGGGGANAGNIGAWTSKGVPDASTANNITAWNLESANFATSHSSGGGRGGYTFSQSNQNPLTLPPGNTTWSGDNRRVYGGMGGEPLDYSTGKIFMGGAGGAGDDNDHNATGGANGGGIVYLLSYGTVSGAGQILSDGGTAINTNWNTALGKCGDDGAGGAGAGGTIMISSVGNITLSNATPLSAQGGKGGNYQYHCFSTSQNFGPGGGGGGGYIGASNTVAGSNVSGGANGICVNGGGNTTQITTKFPPNGATKGDTGVKATITNYYLTANNYTICAGSSASLSVTANGTGIPNPISYNWYNAQAGGSPIFTGNPYNTGALALGTYTFYAGTCPGTYRIPVVVTVLSAPTVTVVATPTTVCAGQTSTLTASGASSFTWSANAGGGTGTTAVVTPTVNTTYTVTGANGTCTNTQTVSVAITSAPSLTVVATPTAVCPGQSATLTASGAPSFTWSANAGGGTGSTAVVTPTVSTTYTVTGGSGTCTNTQTVSVAITSAPTLTVVATPTAVCPGQSATLTASGAPSFTWSANAGGGTSATAVVTPTIATTYTVTGGSGTCTSTQTVSVATTTPPTLTVIATPTAVCPGSSSTLTASGAASYTWSGNAGGGTGSTAVVTPTVSTTYTVTGDNGGCTSTQTVSVAMATPPTLTITATPSPICNGSSSTLSASGATSYTWSSNAGGGNTTTVSVTPSVTTTYTLTGDSGGCVSTQMISVVVNHGPTAADSSLVAAACAQSNGSYSLNSVTGGTAGYQINFNGTGFTPISSFPYTVSNLGANLYPVVIKDNNGCTYTTSVTIQNIGGITKIDSTIGNAICNPPNSGYIVINSVTGGTAPYQVEVNTAGFSAIPSFPDTIKNLTSNSYTITIKDNAGCQYVTVMNVGSSGGITQVNTTTKPAICNPSASGVIVITSVTGGTGPYQYSLNGGTLTNISAFPDSLKNLTPGTYTLLVQDAAGCPRTSTVTVGNPPNGPNALSGTTKNDTCSRSVGMIIISSASGGTPSYQFSVDGGTLQGSGAFTGLAAGVHTVTVQDANGCTHDTTMTIGMTTIPAPVVTAQGTTNLCPGGSVVLSSSSASGNTWSAGAGSATTQTVSVNATGSYWVSVSQSGCTVPSNTVTVTMNANPTIIVNSDTICSGTSATLTATGANTYNWSPPTGLNTSTGSVVIASPGVSTVYTVTGQDANLCMGTDVSTVTVNPIPAALPIDSFLHCLYQTVPTLSVTPTVSGATVNWYSSNMTPLPTAPTPSTNILGTTTYYVTQSLNGCPSAATPVIVEVIPGPSAVFTTNPPGGSVFTAQTVTFTPSQISPHNSYFWNFNEPGSGSANTSNIPTPTHVYGSEGTYCPHLLVISLQTGCVDSNTICLDVFNGIKVVIPNVFTPNQDNINDIFSIKTDGINELICEIYDRWGLKMYSWNGPTGFWDGTTNGKACSDGTYYYVVNTKDVKGVAQVYKGYVQLIR